MKISFGKKASVFPPQARGRRGREREGKEEGEREREGEGETEEEETGGRRRERGNERSMDGKCRAGLGGRGLQDQGGG